MLDQIAGLLCDTGEFKHVSETEERAGPGYVADMREHHPPLPASGVSDFQVESGGIGAGTVTRFKVTPLYPAGCGTGRNVGAKTP